MLKCIFTPADYAECLVSYKKIHLPWRHQCLHTAMSLEAAEIGLLQKQKEREGTLQQIEPKVVQVCIKKRDLFCQLLLQVKRTHNLCSYNTPPL